MNSNENWDSRTLAANLSGMTAMQQEIVLHEAPPLVIPNRKDLLNRRTGSGFPIACAVVDTILAEEA